MVRARGSYPRRPGFESLHRHQLAGPEAPGSLERRALEVAVRRALRARGSACVRRDPGGGPLRRRRLGGPDRRPRPPRPAPGLPAGGGPPRPRPASGIRRGRRLLRHPLRAAGDRAPRQGRADVRGRARTRAPGAGGRGPPRALCLPPAGHGRGGRGRPSRWPTPATTRPRPCSCACSAAPGRQGLSSMRGRRGAVIRPLLGGLATAVLRHLAERGLSWREDPTNADPAHLQEPRPPRAHAPARGPLQPAAAREPGPHRHRPGRRGRVPRGEGGAASRRGSRGWRRGSRSSSALPWPGRRARSPAWPCGGPWPRAGGLRGVRRCTWRGCSSWSATREARAAGFPFPAAGRRSSSSGSSASARGRLRRPPTSRCPSGCRGGWPCPTAGPWSRKPPAAPRCPTERRAVVAAPEEPLPGADAPARRPRPRPGRDRSA